LLCKIWRDLARQRIWRDLARQRIWRDRARQRIWRDRARQKVTNMYHVYILLNEVKTRTYTGVADDVNKRLALHNAGRVKASRSYRPYNIIHMESFETLKEARQKEKFYKSTTGRRRLKEMFF
jgi:putative endonuclease